MARKKIQRVSIDNVVLAVRKGRDQVFQQSIDTKSGEALIFPQRGDKVFFSIDQGNKNPKVVEGEVDKILFGYWFNGQQVLNESVEIELI